MAKILISYLNMDGLVFSNYIVYLQFLSIFFTAVQVCFPADSSILQFSIDLLMKFIS